MINDRCHLWECVDSNHRSSRNFKSIACCSFYRLSFPYKNSLADFFSLFSPAKIKVFFINSKLFLYFFCFNSILRPRCISYKADGQNDGRTKNNHVFCLFGYFGYGFGYLMKRRATAPYVCHPSPFVPLNLYCQKSEIWFKLHHHICQSEE